jgi:hypothetical protein
MDERGALAVFAAALVIALATGAFGLEALLLS